MREKDNEMKELSNKVVIMSNILKKLSYDDFVEFMNAIEGNFDTKLIDTIKDNYAMKMHDLKTADIKTTREMNVIVDIYKEELNKINQIISRDDILDKIGGLRVLVYGKTGTGKTSFVKMISKSNPDIHFEQIDLEHLMSSKMGQTQLNLLQFIEKLKVNSENKKTIIFFDEVDSFISDRSNEDISERQKIIATFIKIMDLIPKNIILFAATNLFKNIDEAVVRRFNYKVEGKTLSIDTFIKNFDFETSESLIRKKRLINEIVNFDLTISDFKAFVDHFQIEKQFNKNPLPISEFIKYFKIDTKNVNLPNRIQKEIGDEKI